MKKGNKIITFFRCIIFLMIGALLWGLVTRIFVPKWNSEADPATERIRGFYDEKPNSLDILCFGNSDIGKGYSPLKVWDEYGITGYNLGTSNQTLQFTWYLMQETLKYQENPIIILDMDGLYVEKDAPEGEYRKLWDNVRYGEVKKKVLLDETLSIEKEDKNSYILRLLRFHSRWDDLKASDFVIDYRFMKKRSYKGMAIGAKNGLAEYEDYMETQNKSLDALDKNLVYLNKIVDLCKSKNLNLVFIEVPSATSWSNERSKKTKELAEKYGIEFIDYNLKENYERINFDFKKDFYDKGNHLNIYGAEKISVDLGRILKTKYNIQSKKDNKDYEDWNKEFEEYNKYKNDLIKRESEEKDKKK